MGPKSARRGHRPLPRLLVRRGLAESSVLKGCRALLFPSAWTLSLHSLPSPPPPTKTSPRLGPRVARGRHTANHPNKTKTAASDSICGLRRWRVSASSAAFQARVAACVGVPQTQQRLAFAGRDLLDGRRADECGLRDDALLSLVSRRRGGGGCCPARAQVVSGCQGRSGVRSGRFPHCARMTVADQGLRKSVRIVPHIGPLAVLVLI